MKQHLGESDGVTRVIAFALTMLVAVVSVHAEDKKAESTKKSEQRIPDGYQTLDAKRHGVAVVYPKGWSVVGMGRGDRAFALSLPTDPPETRGPIVDCVIGVAPTSLEEYRKRIGNQGERAAKEKKPRRLISNEIIQPDKQNQMKMPQLEINWRHQRPFVGPWFEVKRYAIKNGQIYTFTLLVDEPHYEAYRVEFRKMAASARYGPVETGVVQVQDGYWLQREFHFGLKLPKDWTPSFRVTDEVLFLATGATKEVFSDNLLITASQREKIPFAKLQKELPEQLKRARKNAKVVRCETREISGRKVLETVIEISQGPFDFTIFEQRFQGERLNYEVRFTILRENFNKLEKKLKASAASFREFPRPGKGKSI